MELKKNPLQYKNYLKASELSNQEAVEICKKGYMFTKHNFGNLKFSLKYVKFNKDMVEYYKSIDAVEPSAKCKIRLIQGKCNKF